MNTTQGLKLFHSNSNQQMELTMTTMTVIHQSYLLISRIKYCTD